MQFLEGLSVVDRSTVFAMIGEELYLYRSSGTSLFDRALLQEEVLTGLQTIRESLDPTLSVLETLTEGPPGRVVPVQVREPDLALPLEPERPHRGRRRRRAQARSPVQDAGAHEMVALTPVWCLPLVCANVVTWFPDSGLQEPEAEAQVQRPRQRRRFESVYPLSVTDYARAMNEMDRKMGYGTMEDRVLNAERSGLASTSALHGDWPCPNPQCVNSRRLVFAKKTCCPLCKSERPVDFLDPLLLLLGCQVTHTFGWNGCPGRLLLFLLGCLMLHTVGWNQGSVLPFLLGRLMTHNIGWNGCPGSVLLFHWLSDDSHRLSSGEQPRRDRLAKRPLTPPKAMPVPRSKRVAAVADDATLPGITPKSGLLAPPRSLESVAEPTHGPERDARDRRVLVPSGRPVFGEGRRLFHQPEGTESDLGGRGSFSFCSFVGCFDLLANTSWR